MGVDEAEMVKGGKSRDKKSAKSEKSEKRSSKNGVHKTSREGKEKKQRLEKLSRKIEEGLDAQDAAAAPVAPPADKPAKVVLTGAMVSFAVPLADEKQTKKIMKIIQQAAQKNALKRGVKEVVKTLRKSPPASQTNHTFPGVVVIAGDISPEDVISHIPILCEDHNCPYIFVPSRAELGTAARTKRPTSVVMIMEQGISKKRASKDVEKTEPDVKVDAEDDTKEYSATYLGLVKLVKKEGVMQAFW